MLIEELLGDVMYVCIEEMIIIHDVCALEEMIGDVF